MNFLSHYFPVLLYFLMTAQTQSEFTESQLYNIFDMNTFPHHDFVVVTSPEWSSVAAENDLKHASSFDNQFSRFFVQLNNSAKSPPFSNESVPSAVSEKSKLSIWENVGSLLKFPEDDNQSLAVVLFPETMSALPKMVESIAKISNPSNMYFIIVPDEEENVSDKLLASAAQYSDWGQDIYVVKAVKLNSSVQASADSRKFQTIEIYSLQKDKTMYKQVQFEEDKINLDGLLSKSNRRTDMEGSAIRAGAVLEDTYKTNYTCSGKNGTIEFNGGVDAEFWMYLTDSYNLSTIPLNGSRYATRAEKNHSDDVGSKLLNDEIDIVVTAHELNDHRAKRFSFLQSNYFLTLYGFFVQPPASTIRDIFLQAFKTDLWLAMFSTWILIVLGITSLAWVKKRMADLQENEETILSEALLWATGAICQQGWHVYPESTSMKIIFISGLFTGLVSYVAYSAALVSILSLEVVPVRTISDVKSSKFIFYGDELTLNNEYILDEVQAERPELVKDDRFLSVSEGIKKVLHKASIFLGTADGFYSEIQRTNISVVEICSLVAKIPVNRRPIRSAMFVKKGSPLKEYFNARILWMYNNGMRYRLIDTYLRNTTLTCLAKSENQKQPLGLNDVFTAFVILLVGYAVSIVVFIIEKILPRKIEPESSAATMHSNFFKDIVLKDYYY